MNLRYQPADFAVKATRGKIRVIEIVPNQIVTKERIESPKAEGVKSSPTPARHPQDGRRERHGATGNVGVGFVRGVQAEARAIGSTVAHDAHNVVVAGANDADIRRDPRTGKTARRSGRRGGWQG